MKAGEKKEEKPKIETITEKITRFEAELTAAANQFNFCQQKIKELTPKINYLSGKIDALKELTLAKSGE